MTSHPDDDPLLRDPRFDRTWRAVSAEEPPAALDDALRAAARREVGAQPRPLATDVREATRPERWWFPLAAAATIGAVAFGLLQIVGQDRLAGETAPAGVVSDMAAPAPLPESRDTRAGSTAPVPAAAAPPPTQTTPAAAPAAASPTAQSAPPRVRSIGAATPGAASRVDAGRPAVAATTPPLAPQPGTGVTRPPAPEAAAEPAASMPVVTPPPASTPLPAVAPARAPMPFPAAPAKEEQRGDPPAPAPVAPSAVSARALLATPAGGAASVPPARTSERAAATSGKRVAPAADASVESPAREKAAQLPLPVPEWIALIRRLRDEGRLDEARRELADFHKAHPDHAQLLPPDLRDWTVDAR